MEHTEEGTGDNGADAEDISHTRRYCMECGSEIEPGSDFCYQCGSRRIFEVGDGNKVNIDKGMCPYCGSSNPPDSEYCSNCGRRLGEYEYVPVRTAPLTSRDYLIMAAAFIPGALNIFGLGHLLLHKYSRGVMYLAISAVLLYVLYGTPDIQWSTYALIEVLGFVIYLKQSFEVMYEVYNKKDGERWQTIGRKNTGRGH